ncbi:MAG: membrane protein insertion efficiency factor YidD [Pseudobdellovibrionaceae bacterium]
MTPNLASRAMMGLITLYRQILSPLIGGQCRYAPTCSHYGLEAFRAHGFWKGLFLTITRICSCHPFSRRPWSDPVPREFAWRSLLGYNLPTSNQTHEEIRETE